MRFIARWLRRLLFMPSFLVASPIMWVVAFSMSNGDWHEANDFVVWVLKHIWEDQA